MSNTCKHCERTSRLRRIDIPEAAVLCDDCFDKHVWRCDKCGSLIAYPEVGGGQVPGFTPLEFEQWCQDCCSDEIGKCDICDAEELAKDLTATDEGLQCARCARGFSPAMPDDSSPLTQENWKEVALEAIEMLPSEIGASVGHSDPDPHKLRITVAGEPVGCDSDASDATSITSLMLVHFESAKLYAATFEEEQDGMWFPPHIDSDGPVIILEGESTGQVQAYRIGRDTTRLFWRDVQLAILDECWGGGGISLVGKDEKGRYVLDDGRLILPWQ
jgi:hypothetical protein